MPSRAPGEFHWLLLLFVVGAVWAFLPVQALGGSYRDSAHGNTAHGVNAGSIDHKFEAYATGNCAHCHQMHASIEGGEPEPLDGPSPHALFSNFFNLGRTRNPYLETDTFCFYCHSDFGARVSNADYSAAFGGAALGTGPQSILEAFNQLSYHNLYDVWNLLRNDPGATWFGNAGSPCSACHNPHLAKRNADSGQAGFPLLSAITRPDDHTRLWGETELMQSWFGYEAPHAFGTSREPAGVGDPGGGKTPDYVGFCTSCHTPERTIWSTTLNRELKKIDWDRTGLQPEKHGPLARDGESQFREPYASAGAFKSNFVLSCLDCHEAHGSENLMLLRRRINGEGLEEPVTSAGAMGFVCRRCHLDDLAAASGTGGANRWEHAHHVVSGAPYGKSSCGDCHTSGDGTPIACGNCHGHGLDDSWAGLRKTGRKTF